MQRLLAGLPQLATSAGRLLDVCWTSAGRLLAWGLGAPGRLLAWRLGVPVPSSASHRNTVAPAQEYCGPSTGILSHVQYDLRANHNMIIHSCIQSYMHSLTYVCFDTCNDILLMAMFVYGRPDTRLSS